jgi:GNAT superfamily N-acetyltransferase
MPVSDLYKLEPQEYPSVGSIFSELAEIHLNISAVLDRDAAGEVYVDSVVEPQTATITSGDWVYLAGKVDNHAFNMALNASLPRDTCFVLFCDPLHWAESLAVVLQGTYAVRTTRRSYTLNQLGLADWQNRIPDGFSMQRVDADLLAKGLKNCDGVLEGILDEWITVDAFLDRGFGFCLVKGTEIVSWSLSDYVHGDRCEIGIQTDWHHRRRGYGTLTAAANASHAVGRGFSTIGWHCWDNNVGSIGVAEKVGFEKRADYDVFINHWAAENITDMTQDEFRAFARSYEGELAAQRPSSGFPHIVTATAWALSGDMEGCFRHLHKAVDLGWLRSVDDLHQIWPEFFWDPDLDQMEAWQGLVNRFKHTGQPDQGRRIR